MRPFEVTGLMISRGLVRPARRHIPVFAAYTPSPYSGEDLVNHKGMEWKTEIFVIDQLSNAVPLNSFHGMQPRSNFRTQSGSYSSVGGWLDPRSICPRIDGLPGFVCPRMDGLPPGSMDSLASSDRILSVTCITLSIVSLTLSIVIVWEPSPEFNRFYSPPSRQKFFLLILFIVGL